MKNPDSRWRRWRGCSLSMPIFGVAQSLDLFSVYSLLNNDAPDAEHRGASSP